ncbi:hypothetical protein KA344_09450 [bacterium]|nr:hypothetical protein [bacterium]
MLQTKNIFVFPHDRSASFKIRAEEHEEKEIATLASVGGKGLSLIRGSQSGLPVPPGFILAVEFFRPWLDDLKNSAAWTEFQMATADLPSTCKGLKEVATLFKFNPEQLEALEQPLELFAAEALFAVRSSSPEEDLDGASFAGGYETILGVRKDALEEAVVRAFTSCLDYRVVAYKKEHGFAIDSPKLAIIVQRQIASEVAGVAFSLNPLSNDFDQVVINANFGLGETVVSGLATPDAFIIDKVTNKIVVRTIGNKEISHWLNLAGGTTDGAASNRDTACLTDPQILALTALVKQVETLYGQPIDTEWAFANNQLYLLQARPITAYVPVPTNMMTACGAQKHLYLDVSIVVQGLLKPISSMGTDILAGLIKQASKQLFGVNLLGEPIQSIAIVQNGRLYLNLSNVMKIFGKDKVSTMLNNMDPNASRALSEVNETEYVSGHQHPHPTFHLLSHLPKVALRVLRARLFPQQAHKNAQQQIAHFLPEIRAMAQSSMPIYELSEALLKKTFQFIFKTTVPLFLASRFALEHLKSIAKNCSKDELTMLERALPNNITTEMGLALYQLAIFDNDSTSFKEGWNSFLCRFGHRGAIELDIAAPRFSEMPQMLLNQIETLRQTLGTDDNPQARFELAQRERQSAYQAICHHLKEDAGWLQLKRFQSLYSVYETLSGYREMHKYLLIYTIAQLRARLLDAADLLVISKRLNTKTQIFDLTMSDLKLAASDSTYDLLSAARRNRAFSDRLAAVPTLPSLFDSRGAILRPKPCSPKEGEVAGTPMSAGVVRGRIKVLHWPEEKPLLRGEILVARATDPGWTPLFVNASAVILEIGGMLQHGALVAREYGLPCVSGVSNATNLWADGTWVEVDGGSGVIRLLEQELQAEAPNL